MERYYRYTVNGSDFSDEQREFYEENGYILFKKLVSDEYLNICIERFRDVCNGEAPDASIFFIIKDPVLKKKAGLQGEFLINKIQDFLYDDIFYNKYAANRDVVNVVKKIIGPNVTGAHSMLINKPPDSAQDISRHPIHQDLHYFPFRPANKIVASWTAMEKITEENGCLFVIPGSHKSKLYLHEYPSEVQNKAYHGVKGFDHVPKINLIMEKGDTVFFHPLLLHGSGPNFSKGFRKAISVHYADSNSDFINVEGTTQENIEREVVAAFKQKGFDNSFINIWKLKSRLISGDPGSFQRVGSML